MKARKIWIAEHPEDCTLNEVRFIAPSDQGVYFEVQDTEGYYPYKEYVILEVE
jgi:hypothetical protein